MITVSLLIQDIRKSADFFKLPDNLENTEAIKEFILKKYHTDVGILECFINGERLILQWFPKEVDKKAESLHQEAIVLVKKKQFQKAILKWEKAVSLNDQDVIYLYKLGLVYFDMKKYSDSIKYLEKAVLICPIYYRAHLLLGINWIKLRKFRKAEYHVLESNHLNHTNILTYLNLGAIYSYQQRLNEAIEMFNATIQLSPKESRAFLGLARIYNMLNDVETANSYFKKVIELSPGTQMAEYAKRSIRVPSQDETDSTTIDSKEGQVAKGMGFYLSGNYDVSSQQYKEYLTLHPSDNYTWYLLGETKLRTGELTEAADCFKRAIRLNSSRGLYYKSLGVVCHYLNKSKEVITNLKKAVEMGKLDSLCWTLQGVHYSKQNKMEAAMHAFDLAMKKNPNNPLVMYHLASAYNVSKQSKKAEEMIEKILAFEYFVPIKSDAKKLLENIKQTDRLKNSIK